MLRLLQPLKQLTSVPATAQSSLASAERLFEILDTPSERAIDHGTVAADGFGDALVFENDRLTARMNQFFERIESQLRQSLRQLAEGAGSLTPTVDAQAQASALTAFAIGRLQRFARSGFKKSPTEHLDVALRLFAA